MPRGGRMTCTICAAELPPGRHLCAYHRDELLSEIERIPDNLADAEVTIAREDRMGTGSGGGKIDKPSEAPAPVNLHTSDKARELEEAMHSWAQLCLEHDPDADQLRGVEPAAYLRMSVDLIAGMEEAGDCYEELSRARAALVRAIDRPPSILTLGECNVEGDEGRCAGTIRAVKGSQKATCQRCRAVYDAPALQRHMISEAWHVRAPLSEVVGFINAWGVDKVSSDAARKWVTNGDLRTPWADERGRLYTPAQVHAVISEKRRAKMRRRRVA